MEIGPIFQQAAADRGQAPEALIAQLLREPVTIRVPVAKGGEMAPVRCLPGHTAAENSSLGPPETGCDVVVIGKMPGASEVATGRLFSGPSGRVLFGICKDLGIDAQSWYLTNICRFPAPNQEGKLRAPWINECMTLVELELAILKPKYILVLGSEAVKALFGKSASLKKLRGATDLEYNGARVLVTTHPAAIAREPALEPGLRADIKAFGQMVLGKEINPEHEKHYTVIEDEQTLVGIVDMLIEKHSADQEEWYYVDCEWGGTHGADFYNGGRLRTIQFTGEPHTAYLIKVRNAIEPPGSDNPMTPAFRPNIAAIGPQLCRLFCRKKVRLAAHSFRADIKFLDDRNRHDDSGEIFVPCMEQFIHGFDTLTGFHLLHPQAEGNHALEVLSVRYTDCGRYDIAVDEWLRANKLSSKKSKRLRGYADIPDDVLFPYAFRDVDVGIQALPKIIQGLQETQLTHPYTLQGRPINTMYDLHQHVVLAAGLPINEIETVGLYTDRDRMVGLVELFARRKAEMTEEFCTLINWPDFNFRSVDQLKELLFGVQEAKGRLRPEGVASFERMPVKTTEKPPRNWESLSDEDRKTLNPSTDAETIKILAEASEDPAERHKLMCLQRLKFIDQTTKSFLRPPVDDADSDEVEWDSGLVFEIDTDSRTRTSIGQQTDTGRFTSAKPNLQNLTKKQEAELRRIFSPDVHKLEATHGWGGMSESELKTLGLLHPDYYSLRSCYTATPGNVLIEADYVQAELFVLAFMAQDPDMIAVMLDPSRDLHSETAVTAFKLPCAPEEVKKSFPAQRVMAKNVGFGIAYGRGPNALVRQAMAEGVETTPDEMQHMIGIFYEKYPRVKDYVKACHDAIRNPGYVENAYGRRRYFFPTSDRKIMGAQERESQNMGIQGTVGDALSVALKNVVDLRSTMPDSRFKIVLPVHDAIFLDTPIDEIDTVTNVVLPLCMTEYCEIPRLNLKLNIDLTVMWRWQEKVKLEQAIELSRQALERTLQRRPN